jgi:hypothetical protein
MTRVLVLGMAIILWWPLAAIGAEQTAGEAELMAQAQEQPQPPSFAPGAKVTLALTVLPPDQWQLNHLVPLRLQFDEEYLKDAPFTVKQPVWDFTLKSYMPRYTAEIPIQLNADLADGELIVPLEILGSICESSGEACTFCRENGKFKLLVLSQAPPETENQALKDGTASDTHRLSLP